MYAPRGFCTNSRPRVRNPGLSHGKPTFVGSAARQPAKAGFSTDSPPFQWWVDRPGRPPAYGPRKVWICMDHNQRSTGCHRAEVPVREDKPCMAGAHCVCGSWLPGGRRPRGGACVGAACWSTNSAIWRSAMAKANQGATCTSSCRRMEHPTARLRLTRNGIPGGEHRLPLCRRREHEV